MKEVTFVEIKDKIELLLEDQELLAKLSKIFKAEADGKQEVVKNEISIYLSLLKHGSWPKLVVEVFSELFTTSPTSLELLLSSWKRRKMSVELKKIKTGTSKCMVQRSNGSGGSMAMGSNCSTCARYCHYLFSVCRKGAAEALAENRSVCSVDLAIS